MASLVDKLLLLERWDRAGDAQAHEPIDVSQLVEDVVAPLAEAHRERELRLEIEPNASAAIDPIDRPDLEEGVGALVSFDEVYNNLVGEGEINPDVRTEISRIKDSVPGATRPTQKVAEVLYLIRELAYIPRTKDNLARLLALSVDDDIPQILSRIEPELERLTKAKMVAKIGEEYEFLTGERRTFEDELATIEMQYRQQDRESGFAKHFIQEPGSNYWRKWLDFDRIPYSGAEFGFKLRVDGTPVTGTQGHITVDFASPLKVGGGTTLADFETQSLQPDEANTIFFV